MTVPITVNRTPNASAWLSFIAADADGEFLSCVFQNDEDIYAVSCGEDNEYGFPHAAVLANLAAVGSHVYRTDEGGTLVFGTDGKTLRTIPKNTKGL